jgi:hypothetical protein
MKPPTEPELVVATADELRRMGLRTPQRRALAPAPSAVEHRQAERPTKAEPQRRPYPLRRNSTASRRRSSGSVSEPDR